MPGMIINYNLYYTHFSFFLFVMSFMLPFTSSIKYFILINSVIVGIVGNILLLRDYNHYINWLSEHSPTLSQEEKYYQINMSNTIFHTLPLILALILLQGCTKYITNYLDIATFIYYECLLMMVWSLLPYNGLIAQEKISYAYGNSSTYLFLFTLISCLVSFYLLINVV